MRWPDHHPTIEVDRICALRAWFEENHADATGAWIWFWKAGSGRPSVLWSDVVDVLLCFGWIDTKIQPVDADSYVQYVTHRRLGSMWSKVNKAKLDELESKGLMTDAGRAVVARARADGSWTLLDAAEAQVIPDDLAIAFDEHPGSREFFESLTRAQQTAALRRIYLTKRDVTRAKWVAISAERLAGRIKPPY